MKTIALFVSAALLLSLPLVAVDGVTLINQSTVNAAGGFPYLINQPGSYRLSSDLIVPNTAAIGLFLQNATVTLDLNGFTISCASCTAKGNFGIGIFVQGSIATILNGTITGFAAQSATASGIFVQATSSAVQAKINQVTVTNNRFGILGGVGSDVSVTDCTVSQNLDDGVNLQVTGKVLNSSILFNGIQGIHIFNGLISGNHIFGNGNGTPDPNFTGQPGGIVADNTVTVTNNSIVGNNQFGLFGNAGGSNHPLIGFGSNTFGQNAVDVAGSGTVSFKNNASSS